MLTIRQAALQDLPGVSRVCLLADEPDWPGPASAIDGDPPRNPDLLGHVYAAPYVVGQPDLAWAAVDAQGVAGYVLGCADTRAFEQWCESNWWPVWREQYSVDAVAAADREVTGLLHPPPHSPDVIVADHPAHLHIDLLPRAIGTGTGRRMIETLLSALTARGVPGVHLGVGRDNAHAIGFYEHLGFTRRLDDGPTVWMVRSLLSPG